MLKALRGKPEHDYMHFIVPSYKLIIIRMISILVMLEYLTVEVASQPYAQHFHFNVHITIMRAVQWQQLRVNKNYIKCMHVHFHKWQHGDIKTPAYL